MLPRPPVAASALNTHRNGYSATCYIHRWSKVIADALFRRFQKVGLPNPQTAAAYRRQVLEPGTMPAAGLVRDFLGRDISLDAYRAQMALDH